MKKKVGELFGRPIVEGGKEDEIKYPEIKYQINDRGKIMLSALPKKGGQLENITDR